MVLKDLMRGFLSLVVSFHFLLSFLFLSSGAGKNMGRRQLIVWEDIRVRKADHLSL
jgi:hypothetical protein